MARGLSASMFLVITVQQPLRTMAVGFVISWSEVALHRLMCSRFLETLLGV